jgi:predicted component of type VI protein secretion system
MRANLRHASGAIAALAAMTLLVGCSTSNNDSPEAGANRPESDGSNMPFNLSASEQ